MVLTHWISPHSQRRENVDVSETTLIWLAFFFCITVIAVVAIVYGQEKVVAAAISALRDSLIKTIYRK